MKTAIKKSIIAATLAVLLTGCVTTTDEQDYAQHRQQMATFINQSSSNENLTGQDEINWWQQLNSPQLNALVGQALTNNYNLQATQLQLQSALARLGAQRAQHLPQGGLDATSSRSKDVQNGITKQSSANVGFDWQLDLFGKISALVNAANAAALSQAEQVRLLKIEITSSVVNGFISYQGNKQKQQIIQQQIDALKQSIEVLQARFDEGSASELDLNRTKAQLNQQQALMPEIEFLLYRDLTTLALLSGQLASDIKLSDELSIIDTQLPLSLAQPSVAIAMRPDIAQALYKYGQADALSVAAQRALLPTISLSGFAGIFGVNSYNLSNSQQQWQVAPKIEWSLLSYPALLAQRDAQAYVSEAAYSEYKQVVLNAISETELSLKLLIKEQDKQQFADNRYRFANKAFSQAEAMYEEGQIPYLALLDARQDVLKAQENAVDSAVSSLLAKVNAYHAFNGRWSNAL